MAGEVPEVTCGDVRAAIRGGVLTPGIRAHGGGCPACAVLLADDAALGRLLAEPPVDAGTDIADQILARIRQERNPARRLPSWARSALVWAAVLLPAAVILLARPRADLAGYPVPRMIAVLTVWAAMGAIAGLVALRPVHRPLVAARELWVGLALLGPPLLGLLPPVENGLPEPPWLHAAIHCFSRGAAVAAFVLVALRLSDRRTTAGPLWWAGASGLSAVAGGLMLQLSCSVTNVSHLMASHGTIGVVFAGIAAIATSRAARIRPG